MLVPVPIFGKLFVGLKPITGWQGASQLIYLMSFIDKETLKCFYDIMGIDPAVANFNLSRAERRMGECPICLKKKAPDKAACEECLDKARKAVEESEAHVALIYNQLERMYDAAV